MDSVEESLKFLGYGRALYEVVQRVVIQKLILILIDSNVFNRFCGRMAFIEPVTDNGNE